MEDLLKQKLGLAKLESFGSEGGGCINTGQAYQTENGKIFVKINKKAEAKRMFDGEFASLSAMRNTDTIVCPKPIKVLELSDGGAMLVTNYIEMHSLRQHAAAFGQQLAQMHLFNKQQKDKNIHAEGFVTAPKVPYVDKFGFDCTTCCGYLPQNNTWHDDWPTYFTRCKLQQQLDWVERDYGDRQAQELWSQLQRKIPGFFSDIEITPALVHGDLWSGNVSETKDAPVIFDPASFYGHNEYEFGIMQMFGSFPSSVYNAYHKVIPQSPGQEKRVKLYELFHALNHWNHFGGGYRDSSLSIMKQLARDC